MKLTPNQYKLLKELKHYDGEGSVEILINWEYDFKSDKSWKIANFVVNNLFNQLVKKGLITGELKPGTWVITDLGNKVLSGNIKTLA